MLLNDGMEQDNEELTFRKIGIAADLVLTMLRLQARVSEGEQPFEADVSSIEKQSRRDAEQDQKDNDAKVSVGL